MVSWHFLVQSLWRDYTAELVAMLNIGICWCLILWKMWLFLFYSYPCSDAGRIINNAITNFFGKRRKRSSLQKSSLKKSRSAISLSREEAWSVISSRTKRAATVCLRYSKTRHLAWSSYFDNTWTCISKFRWICIRWTLWNDFLCVGVIGCPGVCLGSLL